MSQPDVQMMTNDSHVNLLVAMEMPNGLKRPPSPGQACRAAFRDERSANRKTFKKKTRNYKKKKKRDLKKYTF